MSNVLPFAIIPPAQTVIVHPDNYESLRALLDTHELGLLITLKTSPLMPVDQLYVFHDDFMHWSPTCREHLAIRCKQCWPVEALSLDDV